MKTYFITVQFDSRQQSKYVATESDIDMGGFVDADPENFGFQTREEAEQVKDELVDYAYNKACQEDEDYERYHTREDIAATFDIEEIDIDHRKGENMNTKNFDEIGKALVAFHVSRASWASSPKPSYENDVESFKMLVERCYNDYYGAGKFWLKNMTEDDELMEDEDWTLTDCNGNVLLEGRDEIEAMTGTLEIDGDYDAWYVQRLEDCDEDELKLIYEDGHHHTLSDEDLLAYCCYALDKKMIDSVDYGKEACTVHFTDGTDGTIEFKRDEDITDTIEDFFTENDIDDKSREKFFDDIEAEYEDIFKRFTLYRTANDPQVWECKDQENGIVCRFRWHQFNETQQVKVTDGQTEPDAMAMARAMREMGDWLAENHKDVVF